ncbi:MAG: sigma-70 family RNA polymerase sigma factor [Nannocystis sp.]|nr:sigma-70 family RNA polymerase sigma factor [Nannocystis sp.]
MVSPDADDLTLVEACRSGDRNAFKILMQRYQRKVYSVAFGLLRNQEDALDVVQESFIKVHRYLANFEGNSSFYTWLYRIVTNLCIDHMRKNKRYKAFEFDDSLRHDEKADSASDADIRPLSGLGDPAQMLHRREILDAFQNGLACLSDKHRAVIVMRELEGFSYEEMAKAMGCSKGTIMSRLFHARRNMQRHLTERLGYMPSEVVSDSDGESLGAVEAVMP